MSRRWRGMAKLLAQISLSSWSQFIRVSTLLMRPSIQKIDLDMTFVRNQCF